MEHDWRNGCLGVQERNAQLLEKRYHSDCSFLVMDKPEEEGKYFAAHKLILAGASAVFETMFFGSLVENTVEPIKIVEIQVKIFSKMLKYIYTDAVDLEKWEDAAELFNVAKKYMIHQLKKYCIDYLVKELKSFNALEIYEFAKFHEEANLMDAALKVIREQTITVLDSPSFLTINISTMITILEQDQLQATEMELFTALESLAKSKGVIKKTSLGAASEEQTTELSDEKKAVLVAEFRKALKKVQFNSMTPEQFSNGPSTSGLLFPEEALSILGCLIRPSKLNKIYPKDFQQNIRPSKCLPRVYLEISAGLSSIGRIVIELRSDVVSETVKKFLHYLPVGFKRTELQPIRPRFCQFFMSSTEEIIDPENFILKHSGSGTVSALKKEVNGKLKSVCSHYFISFKKLNEYNGDYVVIGQVVEGMDVIEIIKSYGTKEGPPKERVFIEHCGELKN